MCHGCNVVRAGVERGGGLRSAGTFIGSRDHCILIGMVTVVILKHIVVRLNLLLKSET